MRSRVVFVLSVGVGLAACGLDVVGVGVEPTVALPDAAPAGPSTPDAALSVDVDAADGATADATFEASNPRPDTGPGGCVTKANVSFGAGLPAGWVMEGDATIGTSPARVILTTRDKTVAAGALWMTTPIQNTGRLRVAAAYAIEPGSTESGEGFGIAWVDTSQTPHVGMAGSNFGMCNGGLIGVGAVLRDGDPQRSLALREIDSNCGTNNGILNTAVPSTGTIVGTFGPSFVEVRQGTVAFARTDVVVPANGYVGISGSTGGSGGGGQSSFSILSVRVEVCP